MTERIGESWRGPAGVAAVISSLSLVVVLIASVNSLFTPEQKAIQSQQRAIDALGAQQQVQQTQIGNLTSSIQTLTNNENAQSTALGAIQNEVTQVVQRLDDLSPSAVARHH